MATKSPLPASLPTRPLFKDPRAPIVSLPSGDEARKEAAARALNAAAQKPLLDRIAQEDAAQREAKTQADLAKLADAIAKSLLAGMADLFAEVTDALYDNAAISNPAALAMIHGRTSVLSCAAAETPVKFQNKLAVPVVVVVRADNDPANDVYEVALSRAETPVKDAQVSGVTAIVQPEAGIYIGVKASTYPVRITVSAVPLRGRRAIFGG